MCLHTFALAAIPALEQEIPNERVRRSLVDCFKNSKCPVVASQPSSSHSLCRVPYKVSVCSARSNLGQKMNVRGFILYFSGLRYLFMIFGGRWVILCALVNACPGITQKKVHADFHTYAQVAAAFDPSKSCLILAQSSFGNILQMSHTGLKPSYCATAQTEQ